MAVAVFVLFVSFLIAVALTPVIRSAAIRNDLLDQAHSSRKVHDRPIPRLGGVAIVFAFYAAVGGALLCPSVRNELTANASESPIKAMLVLLGGLAICGLGLYDDLKGAGAKQKFAVQLAVAGMLYAAGLRIEVLDNPFGGSIPLGLLGLPVTVLWITGITNALNLIDGLDGLAGGVAVAAAAMVFAASAHAGQSFAMITGAAVAGAVGGFLVYNFNPASIFMGDTGSMFLGYVIATSAIRPHEEGTHEVALIAWIVALGIPIADTFTAIVRRAVRGSPLFAADREHIHHRLLDLGLTQRQVSLILGSVAALLAGAGMTLTGCSRGTLLVALAFSSVLALNQLGCLRIQNVAALLERRRKNLDRRRAIARVGEELRGVDRIVDLSGPIQSAAPVLGARAIWLRLAGPHRPQQHLRRSKARDGSRPTLWTSHSILGERDGVGALDVEWREDRMAIDRDTEIAVEILCGHVRAAVRRIERASTRPTPWRFIRPALAEESRPNPE